MKILKLNKNFKLTKSGFTHGIKFEEMYKTLKIQDIEDMCYMTYGPQWTRATRWGPATDSMWATYRGKSKGKGKPRSYWIMVRQESMITEILLRHQEI